MRAVFAGHGGVGPDRQTVTTDGQSRDPVTFAVRVKPGASRTRVGGRYDGPLGAALVVAVNSPAVDGRANQAAVEAVAEALGLRPRELAIRSGQTSRNKLITVAVPPADLGQRLDALRQAAR